MTPQAAQLDRESKGCSDSKPVNQCSETKKSGPGYNDITAEHKYGLLKTYPAAITLITANIITLLCGFKVGPAHLNEVFGKYFQDLEQELTPKWIIVRATNTIQALKRLNDGLILSVGDRIKYNNPNSHLHGKIQTIKGFHTGKTGSFCMDTDLTNENGLSVLQDITKVNPLFTTVDGIPVYPGQEVHLLRLEPGNPNLFFDIKSHRVETVVNDDLRSRIYGNRQNAEAKFVENVSRHHMKVLSEKLQKAGIQVSLDIVI